MVIEDLARYLGAQTTLSLRSDVLHHAKWAVIDWFASLFPGLGMRPTTSLASAHRHELGGGASTVLGAQLTASAALAAWINGTASHAAEFDDIFRDAAYHPGSPVVAGALAVAESLGASGEMFLRSVIGGYEVSTRIGAVMQPAHGRHFHATGTVGTLGSAAASAIGFRPGCVDTARHALAIACTFGSGLQRTYLSEGTGKALHAGHAAMMGVLAAQGAASGITAPMDMLEGGSGFGEALGGASDWSAVARGLGDEFNICSLTQKIHGCCGLTFASIDAATALVRAHKLDAIDIREVRIFAPLSTLRTARYELPETSFQARFSLKYVVGHAICFGSVRLDAFSDERLRDPAILALMQRTIVKEDPLLTAAPLSRQRGSTVEIVTEAGELLREQVPYRRGDPEAPLTERELREKYMELSAPVIGLKAAYELLKKLEILENLDIADLGLRSLAVTGVSEVG